MEPKIKKLAYGLGVQVTGVALSETLGHDIIAQLRQAWNEHCVLVFPDQPLDHTQHIAFAKNFGTPELHPEKHLRDGRHPEVFTVTNRVVNGKLSDSRAVGRRWHSDGAFTLRPPTGSLLRCSEIPECGGDTWFTNMYMAYETLSETMKTMIQDLEVINDLSHASKHQARDPAKIAEHLRDNPPVVQPMVRVHPETGRKALYLNETVTRQIRGMTDAESEGLLGFLFRHSVRPEFTYRHRWHKHDLVMWDNRCAMHLAPADYDAAALREMHRVTLTGAPLGRLSEAA